MKQVELEAGMVAGTYDGAEESGRYVEKPGHEAWKLSMGKQEVAEQKVSGDIDG